MTDHRNHFGEGIVDHGYNPALITDLSEAD